MICVLFNAILFAVIASVSSCVTRKSSMDIYSSSALKCISFPFAIFLLYCSLLLKKHRKRFTEKTKNEFLNIIFCHSFCGHNVDNMWTQKIGMYVHTVTQCVHIKKAAYKTWKWALPIYPKWSCGHNFVDTHFLTLFLWDILRKFQTFRKLPFSILEKADFIFPIFRFRIFDFFD